MKYIIPGILLGFILSFFLFQGEPAFELTPGFCLEKEELSRLSISPEKKGDGHLFKTPKRVYKIDKYGSVLDYLDTSGYLVESSGNGKFFIQYTGTGTDIELKNISGERFWKIESREKPFLSYDGNVILLMNGDHSRIRIIDKNSRPIGVKEISGRVCTVLSFSRRNNHSSLGFADGSYYFLNGNGEVHSRGEIEDSFIVKTTSISSNGRFGTVHYGNYSSDFLRIIDFTDKREAIVKLKNVHSTRAALSVDDSGMVVFFDKNMVVFYDSDGDIRKLYNVPVKRKGFAKIDVSSRFTAVSYGLKSGGAQFYLFENSGEVLFSKKFGNESFLDCSMGESLIRLRGSDSLYAYNYFH